MRSDSLVTPATEQGFYSIGVLRTVTSTSNLKHSSFLSRPRGVLRAEAAGGEGGGGGQGSGLVREQHAAGGTRAGAPPHRMNLGLKPALSASFTRKELVISLKPLGRPRAPAVSPKTGRGLLSQSASTAPAQATSKHVSPLLLPNCPHQDQFLRSFHHRSIASRGRVLLPALRSERHTESRGFRLIAGAGPGDSQAGATVPEEAGGGDAGGRREGS